MMLISLKLKIDAFIDNIFINTNGTDFTGDSSFSTGSCSWFFV